MRLLGAARIKPRGKLSVHARAHAAAAVIADEVAAAAAVAVTRSFSGRPLSVLVRVPVRTYAAVQNGPTTIDQRNPQTGIVQSR